MFPRLLDLWEDATITASMNPTSNIPFWFVATMFVHRMHKLKSKRLPQRWTRDLLDAEEDEEPKKAASNAKKRKSKGNDADES